MKFWWMSKTILGVVLILVGLALFYCAYDNWRMDQEFIASPKGHSLGTVHLDKQGVQTVSFPENDYGVSIEGKGRNEGEQVYIYYQKDKPYRISTSPKHYKKREEIYKPILGGIFFIFYVGFNQIILPKIARRLTDNRALSE